MPTTDNADFEIKSLEDLSEAARRAHEKFKKAPWFRGHRDGTWKLQPKAYRTEGDPQGVLDHEKGMAQQFKARAQSRHTRECPGENDYFGWLALMQHFGLPTRLLDWTRSILVAAYFAVADEEKENPPAIWALNPYALNAAAHSPGTRYHCNVEEVLYVVTAFTYPVSPEHPYVQRLASRVFRPETSDEEDVGSVNHTIAVAPPENDLRMLVQHATFTIHGNLDSLEGHDKANEFIQKFRIAESSRLEIREHLKRLHINESALFPDLDRLSEEIATSTSTVD